MRNTKWLLNAIDSRLAIIWAVSLAIFGFLDMLSTYAAISPSVVENNFILNWGIETFGPVIGIFILGGIIKLASIVFFFFAFCVCFKIAGSITHSVTKQAMRGFLFGAMFIPHFMNLVVVSGNLKIAGII